MRTRFAQRLGRVFGTACILVFLATHPAMGASAPKDSTSSTEPDPIRKAEFGVAGALADISNDHWKAWQSAYFERPSERGLGWGASLYARYAFSPDRLFSAQLALEGDYLTARSSVPGRARASFRRTGVRFGANCLFPSFASIRPSLGFGGGVAQERSKLVVNGRTIATGSSDLGSSYIDLAPYGNVALVYRASQAIGIETGFVGIFSRAMLFKLGANYEL